MRILIQGARTIDAAAGIDKVQDVLIADQQIEAIDAGLDTEGVTEIIEAKGRWLLPGMVDLSAQLPAAPAGSAECLAAAAGGVTTLCVPPDGFQRLDDPTDVRDLMHGNSTTDGARVFAIGGLTLNLEGAGLTDMAELKEAGCLGVGNGRHWVRDTRVMRCAMQYAADLDLCVFIAPRDPWLTAEGCAHAGRVATRLGLTGIPAAAETSALARDLALVEDTGVRAHFGPLSSAAGIELIRRAQAAGLPVTADTALHHLFLTEMDLTGFDAACRTDPPLRTQEDREALRRAVADGTLMIRSDHRPLTADARMAPFPAAEPGISGVQTMLSLGLRLVQEEVLTAAGLVARTCLAPAELLGIPAGRMVRGAPADLLLVDPDAVWRVDPEAEDWLSMGRNTPFAGWELQGRAIRTMVAGRWVGPTRGLKRETATGQSRRSQATAGTSKNNSPRRAQRDTEEKR